MKYLNLTTLKLSFLLIPIIFLTGCGDSLEDRAELYEEEAMYELSLKYIEDGDSSKVDKAYEMLTWAGDVGHTPSQLKLSQMLMNESVFPKDIKSGVSWLERAGRAGSLEAQLMLIELYSGDVSKNDELKKIMWIKNAAEQGHAESQFKLGLLFGQGKMPNTGGKSHYEQGLMWLKRAAEQGSEDAINAVVQVEEAESNRLLKLAAEKEASLAAAKKIKEANEVPKYTDQKSVFALRNYFNRLMSALGYLENAIELPESIKTEVSRLNIEKEELRKQYVSDHTKKAWSDANDFYERVSENTIIEMKNMTNRNYRRQDSDAPDAFRCDSIKGNGYGSSDYVAKINQNLSALRQNIHRLKQKLPEPKVGGQFIVPLPDDPDLMLFCNLNDGTMNPAKQAYLEKINQPPPPKRIAPFSSIPSNPQAEMTCRNLSNIKIPPPQNLSVRYKCVENFAE
jgi:TPR repeat protein